MVRCSAGQGKDREEESTELSRKTGTEFQTMGARRARRAQRTWGAGRDLFRSFRMGEHWGLLGRLESREEQAGAT